MEASRNPSVHAFSSSSVNNSSNGNSSCLLRSASQQLFLDIPGVGAAQGAGFLGPRPPLYASCPPPVPTYSSLPTSHLLQQPHPPLLPIPLSKSPSLPSPSPPAWTRRMGGGAAVRPTNKDSKKTRPQPAKPQPGGARPRKEPPPAAVPPPARVLRAPAASPFKDEPPEEEEEVDASGDVYSLSPPPSSLPMPRFFLRARTHAEAFGGNGGDAGASDDLRRLLRL